MHRGRAPPPRSTKPPPAIPPLALQKRALVTLPDPGFHRANLGKAQWAHPPWHMPGTFSLTSRTTRLTPPRTRTLQGNSNFLSFIPRNSETPVSFPPRRTLNHSPPPAPDSAGGSSQVSSASSSALPRNNLPRVHNRKQQLRHPITFSLGCGLKTSGSITSRSPRCRADRPNRTFHKGAC